MFSFSRASQLSSNASQLSSNASKLPSNASKFKMEASSSSSDSSIIRREAPPAIVRGSHLPSRRPTTPTPDTSPGPSNALSSIAYSPSISEPPSVFPPPPLFEDEEHHRVVCAVAESRSAGILGLAVVNLTLATAQIVRIINGSNYTTLKETLASMPHKPTIFVILPRINVDRSSSKLPSVLLSEIPWSNIITTVPREYWSKEDCLKHIEYYAHPDQVSPLKTILSSDNFYAACAFSAIMAYIDNYEKDFLLRPQTLHVEYVEPLGVMRMDKAAISALELVRNVYATQPGPNTLLGLMNHTRTPEGRRLLTRHILQPMTNEQEISLYHNAIEALCHDEDVFRKLRQVLKNFERIDLEAIAGWLAKDPEKIREALQSELVSSSGRHMSAVAGQYDLAQAEGDLSRILGLKSYLKNVQALNQLLRAADVTDHLLASVASKTDTDKTAPPLGLLEAVVQEDAVHSRNAADIRRARTWAVRASPNDAIELARAQYRATLEQVQAYFEEKSVLFQETVGEAGAPKLEVNDTGYCFKFKWADVRQYLDTDEPQPGETWGQAKIGCVRVNLGGRKGEHYLCQTDSLLRLSQRAYYHADIITKASDKRVLELREQLAESGCLPQLVSISKAVAQLDLVCSHAEVTTTQGYVRPKLGKELALTKARHPIMEARRAFVSNDAFSGEDTKFVVVTGTNMGGKTTYIKAIALIQILAQVGCYVPAERAAVPICDRLFVRSATNDNAAGNAGTFAVEMDEMSVILHGATDKSLVVIDELGRGTSTNEGLGLAAAMAEELVKRKSRVFFATHFLELGKMLNAWFPSQVLNIHMSSTGFVDHDHATISLPHTVVAGPVNNWDYGLELASRYFPPSLIESAKRWSKYQQDQEKSNTNERSAAEKKAAAEVGLMAHVEQALSSQMSNMELADRLEVVAEQYEALDGVEEASNDNDEA
ncbi:muts domain V-domain-containing protein [Apiosordaria backusii]|uniref:DNA mismatch repair protein MSH3 n=1 Tax=Apiosordaria backusii TaxID=314023 RepID=A0AA40K747_9PEZI|nr:muts domain V-domain-containing protein [Apiosordaria backusii]